jgi:hypothetical protein
MWFNYHKLGVEKDRDSIFTTITTIWKPGLTFDPINTSPPLAKHLTITATPRRTATHFKPSVKYSKYKMSKASGANIACGILALLAFVVKLVLNYLGGCGKDPFPRSNKNVSDIFYLEITPAGWAFSIWGLIYTLNGGYIIYALSTLFRDFPAVFTSKFFLACVVSDAFNMAWLFTFAYLEIGWSCGAIIAYALGLYAVFGVVSYNYESHKKELQTRFSKDVWVIQILTQNGKELYNAYISMMILAYFIRCLS